MKSKSDIESTAGGGLLIRDFFGFLWDFRERAVNHRSFWYGYLMSLVICKVLDAVWEWEMPTAAQLLVLIAYASIGKWMQATHPLNVKGHASPEHAPKIDQTASSASHVPTCSLSSSSPD